MAAVGNIHRSNPGGGRDFPVPVQTGPGAHPASYTMGTGSRTGVKRPDRVVDHPPPSRAEVRERVQPYLYSHSGPSWNVVGWTIFFTLPTATPVLTFHYLSRQKTRLCPGK